MTKRFLRSSWPALLLIAALSVRAGGCRAKEKPEAQKRDIRTPPPTFTAPPGKTTALPVPPG